MLEIAIVAVAYLIGSVPTGYILGSRAGIDIRNAGSGNIGATNVARVLGKRHGILTLLVDIGKGYLAVFIATKLSPNLSVAALAGAAVFLGHLYPVFLRFRGGKGVATAFGVYLALAPLATLGLIVIFAVNVLTSRIVSLSSMITAGAAPFVLWLFSYPLDLVAMSAFFAVMIILRHHANIKRLLHGNEPRFGVSSR